MARIESGDEVLQGTESLLARLGRHRRATRWAIGALVAVLTATLTVLHVVRPGPPASRFTATVSAAGYDVPADGGVTTVLTLTNPTAEPLTLTAVTLGSPDRDNPGLGTAILTLGLSPGGRQTVTIHGDFDCDTSHPAIPSYALLTGADRSGRVGTVQVTLPGSAAFAAGHEAFRDQICRLPYPLAYVEFGYAGYAGLVGAAASGAAGPGGPGGPRSFAMTLTVTLDPAATPISLGALGVNVSGIKVLSDSTPLPLSPATTTKLTTTWSVDDCRAIPAYYGVPAIVATATNPRATETREYALGAQFDHDLATALAAACGRGGG